MGIANRDLDSSEQLMALKYQAPSAIATGVTTAVGLVPTPGQLAQVVIAGLGVSGSPHFTPSVRRWTAAGVTQFAIGGAVTLAASFGVSGSVVGATYAMNSSLAALQAGDVLYLTSGGANSAVGAGTLVDFVIKATQDIKTTHDIK